MNRIDASKGGYDATGAISDYPTRSLPSLQSQDSNYVTKAELPVHILLKRTAT